MDFRKVGLLYCPYNKTHWVKPEKMGNHNVHAHSKELGDAHKRTDMSEMNQIEDDGEKNDMNLELESKKWKEKFLNLPPSLQKIVYTTHIYMSAHMFTNITHKIYVLIC